MTSITIEDFCELDERSSDELGAGEFRRRGWEKEGIVPRRHKYATTHKRRTVSPTYEEELRQAVRTMLETQGAGIAVAHASTASTLVFDHIKEAPVAYFKFFSAVFLVLFVFSVVFYHVFDAILVNPIFAVFGALGAAVSWVLVTLSAMLQRKR